MREQQEREAIDASWREEAEEVPTAVCLPVNPVDSGVQRTANNLDQLQAVVSVTDSDHRTNKHWFGFLSHFKRECGTEARLGAAMASAARWRSAVMGSAAVGMGGAVEVMGGANG